VIIGPLALVGDELRERRLVAPIREPALFEFVRTGSFPTQTFALSMQGVQRGGAFVSREGEPVNAGRIQGKFAKGHSGNSAGKPRGARHYTTPLAEALIEGEADAFVRKVIELAIAGDVAALKICLDRILPARRDRSVHFKVTVTKDADLVTACDEIMRGLANGQLTPSEAATITGVIEARCRVLEHVELIDRIEALEARL
jgi:hypothetical protein